MTDQHTQIVNEHLKQNASSDTEEDVRRRRRAAELEAERAKEGSKAPTGVSAGKSPASQN